IGNNAPVAANDSYSVDEDGTLTVPATGVLSNDSDADGNSLTVASPRPISGPSHGTLTLNANGSFTYTPAANYNGPDSFTYQATDGAANSTPATVSITVNPVDDPPVAVNDSATTNEDTAVTIAVLNNDSDVDGDPLTSAKVTDPAHGTVTHNANGTFTYTPAANYNGGDSFTYKACDNGSPSLCSTA